MTALVGWNTRWYQPGESLWSVANKLAYAACASVKDVLYLLAVVADSREAWLFPSTDQAIAVCELLELPLSLAKGQLFADVCGLPGLQEREHWQLGVRYCPHCIQGFVHRTAFQDLRQTHCPVHQAPLLSGCPACKSSLDPACEQPWSCSHCGLELVGPGTAWTRQFKAGPTLEPVTAMHPVVPAVQPIWMPDQLLRRWVAQVAFEEHSALWSTLLGEHAACTHKDFDVCNVDSMPTRFTCPVAGAAWLSAKSMGIRPQFYGGGWPATRPEAGAGLANAVFLVSTLPAEEVDAAVRALVRQWSLELLEAFGSAAEAGETYANWASGPLRLPKRDRSIYKRIADSSARAGRGCGFTSSASSKSRRT